MIDCRESRCAFVVIKLKIDGKDYFVLRRDKDWNDLNLIGGHQEEKDNGRFKRTARREMFEELSALRGKAQVALQPITERISYGPVWSQSAKCESLYHLVFFLAQLETDPSVLEKTISAQSMNFLVDSESLKNAIKRRDVSAFLRLLESEIPGGLEAIPYSLDRDLGDALDSRVLSKSFHKQLRLFHEKDAHMTSRKMAASQ